MAATSNETTIVAVGGTGKSVRTIIPRWIVQQLGYEVGDKLIWKLKATKGQFKIEVCKREET
tara:strand:- start:361 stop:546 length:186 start_codon:yes stop_codon:yes gene_type:complete